jgi:predicted TIM-barrel fold metal-dependent hydrolase
MISLLVRKHGRTVLFIRPTLEVTSGDHILFSTDCPAAPEPTVVGNIANLTSFDGFTADELCGVERDNALRLLPRFA